MKGLFSEYILKGRKINNRIIFPAMLVCDKEAPGGFVSKDYLDHYKWLCDTGVGMIIAGASCVSPDGMMRMNNQLCIWGDEYIDGLSEIAKICHERGVAAIMMINHAGFNSVSTKDIIASSECDKNRHNKMSRALSVQEIKKYQKDYIDAALRAQKAGFDGVEIQCSHRYLIDTFFSGVINTRTDEYGGSAENRARFATEIIQGIKKEASEDFIIACRMAYNAPEIDDAIEIAKVLDKAGADLLDISWGTIEMSQIVKGEGPKAPKDFKHGNITYGASLIKKNVSAAVAAVWQIGSDQAGEIIEKGYTDFVDVLRGILVDPDWVKNARSNKKSNPCLNCYPGCKWFQDRTLCPVRDKIDVKARL